jgi:hypothetical protein
MYLQECRIFAEETNSGRASPASSASVAAGLSPPRMSHKVVSPSRKVTSESVDEFGWDEPSPRLC